MVRDAIWRVGVSLLEQHELPDFGWTKGTQNFMAFEVKIICIIFSWMHSPGVFLSGGIFYESKDSDKEVGEVEGKGRKGKQEERKIDRGRPLPRIIMTVE